MIGVVKKDDTSYDFDGHRLASPELGINNLSTEKRGPAGNCK